MLNNALNNAIIYEMNIVSHNGDVQDLSMIFNGLDIYEDMFKHHLYGYLNLTDTSNILNTFPITGGEIIRIGFGDNKTNSARFVDFVIKGVAPQPNTLDESNRDFYHMFKLISLDGLNGQKVRFSKKFDDSPTSIMQDLFSATNGIASNKIVNDQISAGNFNRMEFVSNNWNLRELIDYLCSQNVDAMFFETIDQYVFAKLSDLINQEPIEELFHSNSLETLTAPNSVHKRAFSQYFDLENLLQKGGFGNIVYDIDVEKYGFNIDAKDLDSVYGNDLPLMGSNKIFHSSQSAPYNRIKVNYEDSQSALLRNIILQTFSNYNLIVRLNGKATRNIGQKIIYNMPAGDNTILNHNFSNDWLITQIRHIISPKLEYKQNVRLFKNAFFNNPRVG